jgi:hypothetical protein
MVASGSKETRKDLGRASRQRKPAGTTGTKIPESTSSESVEPASAEAGDIPAKSVPLVQAPQLGEALSATDAPAKGHALGPEEPKEVSSGEKAETTKPPEPDTELPKAAATSELQEDKNANRLATIPLLAQAARSARPEGAGSESEENDPTLTGQVVGEPLFTDGTALSLGPGTLSNGTGDADSAMAHVAGIAQGHGEPIVERVNPNYPSPPCSPQEIVGVQNQILNTLDARSQAEEASAVMAKQQNHHKANQDPLVKMQKSTADALNATEAHKQAVARRTDANQKKEKNEDQAANVLSDYSNRAAKLSTITVPMKGFERFTSLASSLPEDPSVLPFELQPFSGTLIRAKHAILKMNTDSKRFLDQLDKMDSTIKEQKTSQAERGRQVQADAKTLKETDKKAAESGEELNQAKQTTQDLDKTNKDRLDEATKIRTEADQTAATLDSQVQQKEANARSLAVALQAWAPMHRGARLDALDRTRKKLELQGYKITEVSER